MKTKIACIASLYLISLSPYALEVTNVKTHCTNPSCRFTVHTPGTPGWTEIEKKKQIEKGKSNWSGDDTVEVFAHAYGMRGAPGKEVQVNSEHIVTIFNKTDHILRFVVKYDLSVGDDDFSLEKNVNLNAGETFSEDTGVDGLVIRPEGKYTIIAQTLVNGDDTQADLSSAPLVIGDGKYKQ